MANTSISGHGDSDEDAAEERNYLRELAVLYKSNQEYASLLSEQRAGEALRDKIKMNLRQLRDRTMQAEDSSPMHKLYAQAKEIQKSSPRQDYEMTHLSLRDSFKILEFVLVYKKTSCYQFEFILDSLDNEKIKMKLRIEPDLFIRLPKNAATLNDASRSLDHEFVCFLEAKSEESIAFNSLQLFIDAFVLPYFLKRSHENTLIS